MTSIPQSLLSNPGSDAKYSWFIGVPLVSGFSANVGSSSFSAYDLFANDGVNFNEKLKKVISSSTRNDMISINQQLEVFSGGIKLGDWQKGSYLSFGMYQEFDVLAYIPKDYAILALYGNKDYIGKVFNLGDLNARGELISVFHLGYHKNVNEKLILGARGKIYCGIANVTSTKNSGEFYTIQETSSSYDQVISSNAFANTSGVVIETNNVGREFIKKAFLMGDLGLGFDVGMTYYPKKNIQFTASIIDVGFISHTKDVSNYIYKGYYNNNGISPDFIIGNGGGNILGEFKAAIPLDTLYNNYTTIRPIKFNSSIEYSFGDGRKSECNCEANEMEFANHFGVQLFGMSTPKSPLLAFTAYYRRRILDFLEVKATYMVDSFSTRNVGLGLSSTIGKVNFYLIADNLLEYRDISKANSMAFQLGINVIMPDNNTPD